MGTLVYLFVCLSLSPLNTTLERNTVSLFAEVSGLSPDLLTDMDDGADLQGKYNVSFCISPRWDLEFRNPSLIVIPKKPCSFLSVGHSDLDA